MQEPLVSVVVPAYNRGGTIARSLESISAQTYQNWQAIVVDDGSADATAEIVGTLAREDARFRLIRHAHNRGAQAARNTGIRAARGSWIAFLDADDQFLPDSLRVRLLAARAEGRWVVHSGCNMIDRDGDARPYRVPALSGWIYPQLL
jgi:glycosyltransferase involved in cell wall biosynthesis